MTFQRPGALNWFLLMSLGIIWGGSFPAVAFALTGFGPLTTVALRLSVAAVLIGAFAFIRGDGLPGLRSATGRRIWLHCLGLAVFSNVLPFSLLSWGQLYVSAGFAGINMAVVPLLVLPLAHVLLPDERMTALKSAGFVTGFCGVAVLIGPGIFDSTGAPVELLARLACFSAALCYAIGGIVTRLSPPAPLLSFAAASLILAAIIAVPLSLSLEGIPQYPPPEAMAGIAYLGVVPTAVATLILVRIITTAGPSFLSLTNYQVPVWAIIIGMVMLSESLPAQFVGALALILSGLVLANATSWRTARRQKNRSRL